MTIKVIIWCGCAFILFFCLSSFSLFHQTSRYVTCNFIIFRANHRFLVIHYSMFLSLSPNNNNNINNIL